MFKKSVPLYHVLTLTDVHETCSEREIMTGVTTWFTWCDFTSIWLENLQHF